MSLGVIYARTSTDKFGRFWTSISLVCLVLWTSPNVGGVGAAESQAAMKSLVRAQAPFNLPAAAMISLPLMTRLKYWAKFCEVAGLSADRTHTRKAKLIG